MTLHEFKAVHPEHTEEVEERAAIMEYHGDVKAAEAKAVQRMLDKVWRVLTQGDDMV